MKTESFLVDFWESIFNKLSKISIFYWLRKLSKNMSHRFVDYWVMGNMLAAIMCSIVVFNIDPYYQVLLYIINIYGALRVFEIIIYQINVILFDPYRDRIRGKTYKIKSVTRMVIALIHNYFEIIFWYTTFAISILKYTDVNVPFTYFQVLESSVLCFTTFDKSVVGALGNGSVGLLSRIAFWEIISGLIMTIISLARFIGILPSIDGSEH